MYNLFLDDTREPKILRHIVGPLDVCDEEFLHARSFDEFYKIIKENGIPKFVSFDYDLGSKEDGLDCAEFLKFECNERQVSIPEYTVHSAWPGINAKFKNILG